MTKILANVKTRLSNKQEVSATDSKGAVLAIQKIFKQNKVDLTVSVSDKSNNDQETVLKAKGRTPYGPVEMSIALDDNGKDLTLDIYQDQGVHAEEVLLKLLSKVPSVSYPGSSSKDLKSLDTDLRKTQVVYSQVREATEYLELWWTQFAKALAQIKTVSANNR